MMMSTYPHIKIYLNCFANQNISFKKHNAERLLKLIDEVYRWLPLGTIVNNRVLVVHGGISDSTDLDLIKSMDRSKVSLMILPNYGESCNTFYLLTFLKIPK